MHHQVDLTRATVLWNVIQEAMLAIRLEKELEEQIDLLAKVKQSNRSDVVREAVIRYLDDNEYLELARQALAETKGGRSLKELRKDLGLDGCDQ